MQGILIVGSKRDGAIEHAYANALRRLHIPTVDHFDSERAAAPLAANRIVNRLTTLIQGELTGRSLFAHLRTHGSRYEVIFIFQGKTLPAAWIARCRQITRKALWLNFNPDDPLNIASRGSSNRGVLRSIPLFDVYAIWARSLVPRIHDAGCKTVFYLPFGYDADAHFAPSSLDEGLRDHIVFIGGWDPQREELLTAVADFPLKIYGFGWDRLRRGSPLQGKVSPKNVYGEALRRIIASAKAALNILRPQNTGSHNMRTFEIPAMGGLMITTRSSEQEAFFPENSACLMYADPLELRTKLEAVMSGSLPFDTMRETSKTLSADHSYDQRARLLVATLEQPVAALQG